MIFSNAMRLKERITKSFSYRWPRIKYQLFYRPFGSLFCSLWSPPQVYSLEDTMMKLVNDRNSICRFGNAEFDLIFGVDQDYQKYEKKLGQRLLEILNSQDERILIGIPDVFDDLTKFEPFTRKWWKEYLITYSFKYRKLFKHKNYYNAFISRTSTDFMEDQTGKLIQYFKALWDKRNVLIVEGKNTRIGLGNDFLSNAKEIQRILVPDQSAFSKYDEIIGAIKKYASADDLIVLAAGPTATVLAFDLAQKGFQALDLGHFDIQYEHYIRGYRGKHPIPGKRFNEIAVNDYSIEDKLDKEYRRQIVYQC